MFQPFLRFYCVWQDEWLAIEDMVERFQPFLRFNIEMDVPTALEFTLIPEVSTLLEILLRA